MLLYRIEDSKGIGIYQSLGSEEVQKKTVTFVRQLKGLNENNYSEDQIENFYQASLNVHRPFPEDFAVKLHKEKLKQSDMFSAFTSTIQMFRWFDFNSLIDCIDKDLYVLTYNSEKYVYNTSQAVFLKKEASFVFKEKLETFLEREMEGIL